MNRFRDAFCEYVGCRPENYVREALRRTLYPHAAKFGRLARCLCSRLCEQLLEDAGATTSGEELREVIRLYEYDVQLHGGFWTRRLKFRVSGQRLLDLYVEIRNHVGKNDPPANMPGARSGPAATA
jgi:hypothetical protein